MPGGTNSLSGGLGDLRANHFHAGLDIRTQGHEGLEVYAAADGYVSRIAVFTGGYGNVVFIKHPNGLTTVYGHLKTLNDTLGRYLRAEQYRQKTFEIDLRLKPGQFRVEKGEVIALSGNTGGSGGPHLHFEVRDANDDLLNPLRFNFPELSDDIPPYFERIALKTLTPRSRINGEYNRTTYIPVRQPDGSYSITQPITASGVIGLELLAYDKTNGSPYRNGLNCVEIRFDGREVFAYNMDAFPHEQTRFINVHMNYEVEQTSGQRYHRAYVANGNGLNLYQYDSADGLARKGKLSLLDGKPHEVTITLFDAYENAAELHFTLLPEPATVDQTDGLSTSAAAGTPNVTIQTDDHVLKLTAKNLPAGVVPVAQLFAGHSRTALPASYVRNNQVVYLIDLSASLPDSVQIGSGILQTNLRKRVMPGQADCYEDGDIRLQFSPQTLFDTLDLAVRKLPGAGGILEINQSSIPLNDYLTVTVKPQASTIGSIVATDSTGRLIPERTQMYLTSGGKRKNLGGVWKNGRIEFKTRELGRFQLFTDTIPPKIQLITKNSVTISAKISDNLSGINTFRAFVNGEWVLMQYDYKRALIWSDKLDPAQAFRGDIVLEVTDRAGNVATLNSIIN